MKPILFVDDEPHVLQALTRSLAGRFSVDTALSGAEGLRAVRERGPYAVIVSDMRMPHMDGAAFLSQVRTIAPDSVRVMLTGNSDLDTAIRAVNEGAIFRFATKPCPTDALTSILQAALRQHDLIHAERDLLEGTLNGCISVLTDIQSMVDARQFARATELRELVSKVCGALRIEGAWQIRAAAMLLDVGTIAVPPVVLVRERQGADLTGPERDMLSRIPDLGFQLLRRVPRLDEVATIVRYQHKNYDGTGYPTDTVRGAEIPLGARLLRILVDAAGAASEGMPMLQAVGSLRRNEVLYDPDLLARVAAVFETDAEPVVDTSDLTAVAAAHLRIGDVLATPAITAAGTVLVVQGTKIDAVIRERLINFAAAVGIREPLQVRRAAALRERVGA